MSETAPVRYWAAAKVPSSWRALLSFSVRCATSSSRSPTRFCCLVVRSLAALYFSVATPAWW